MVYGQTYDNYTVQKGDSLWIISLKYQIGLDEIIAANPEIKNPALIYPNQKVLVPLKTETKAIEEEVVELTNAQRQKVGLTSYQHDWELQRTARYKSCDMRDNGYFSHQSPVYGSPFEMMSSFGISYQTAGENIAKGQTSAQQVVNSWMNSSGHRANILSQKFTHIGVGYCSSSQGGYWTQMFIAK
ncbi:CAP domain-containing protein [Bacillus carboniphilus]|uniref:CAP domain-containing protein n=2 Tax=Bacillus carboniphilus TaxID=86663 RepID=A0ABY9K1A2_9BACI|nr:CAP domain-containing protein [Bacillus carboniphilus]WLR44373.1 CAP domain-containing protein [Bacillus carboniphilus]